MIAAGPRSPTPGAPYAYVTTPGFLSHFGFESLRDLPDIEKLEDAGLLGRTSEAPRDGDALASELRWVLGLSGDEDQPKEDAGRNQMAPGQPDISLRNNSAWRNGGRRGVRR